MDPKGMVEELLRDDRPALRSIKDAPTDVLSGIHSPSAVSSAEQVPHYRHDGGAQRASMMSLDKVSDQVSNKPTRAGVRGAKAAAAQAPQSPPPIQTEPTARIVEYDSAISRHEASFTQLGAAIFFARPEFSPDPSKRLVSERYIEPLTEAFEAAHGHITHSFYCRRVTAAAVLTDRHQLWVIHPPLEPNVLPIADLLFECDRLNTEADRVLVGKERSTDLQTTKILIYGALVKSLALLDSQLGPAPKEIIELHKRELEQAAHYYLRAASRYAKFDYFVGMLVGIFVCLLVIALGALVWVLFGFDAYIGKILVGCLVAGGIGAVISVLSRMTFGELVLDYEAGRRLLTMFGGFRPVIGMAFGAAMWVMAGSGVLALGPSEASKIPYFQILIAFLAGFSERWAQDMLGRTADQIGAPRKAKDDNKQDVDRMTKPTAKANGEA
jgi:hypothetical protein